MRTALFLYGAAAAGLVAAVFLSMSAIYLFPAHARWKLGVSYFVIGLGLLVATVATAGRT